jgi:putative membrane fusion protein
MYITAPRISVYEVRQGSILKDNAYTGVALRDETVIYSDATGYANYYVENNCKVRVGTKIYTITDEKLVFEENIDTEHQLTAEENRSVIRKIQAYNNQFQEGTFGDTYQLKTDLQNALNSIASNSKADQLNELLSSGTYPDLTVRSSAKDGIVVYAVDGMEELTCETISKEQLRKSSYKKTEFASNTKVKSGQPVYKVVTSDNWKLLIPISKDTKEALDNKQSIKVNFKKDNQEIWGTISYVEEGDKPILCLSFDKSMIRYINDRYLDVELILEDETGLKIPKSAETSKDFYVVPKSYVTQGGNSSNEGVMRQTTNADGEKITEFLQATVYYEEDEFVYLDPNVFDKGDILLKPDSNETLHLQEKKSLVGVYCINKGYAVFKQIHVLCESDEYYIIEEGNSFGLSNYDHIALDSKSLKENDVVF